MSLQPKRLKILNGYAAHARFLAEVTDGGWILSKTAPVQQPFRSGPTNVLVVYQGQQVLVAETSQRRYEVWTVGDVTIYPTEEAAMEDYK